MMELMVLPSSLRAASAANVAWPADEGHGMKITVIGGGSTYTPELVEGLLSRREMLDLHEIHLVDSDADRLRVLGPFAQRMAAADGGGVGGAVGHRPTSRAIVRCRVRRQSDPRRRDGSPRA